MKSGQRKKAEVLLRQAVAQNPRDAQAWLWLSGVVNDSRERLQCLQRVLAIDPCNKIAIRGVIRLAEEHIHSQAASPARNVATLPKSEEEWVIFRVRPSEFPFLISSVLIILLVISMLTLSSKANLDSLSEGMWILFSLAIGGTFFWKLGQAFLQAMFHRYTLTNKRLIVRKGILNRHQKVIPLQKIQDVSVQQPLLLRLLGMGNILVESAGGRSAVRLIALPACEKLAQQILKQVEQYQ